MPNLESDLGLNHTQAGSLFLLIATGYFITLMNSGFVSSRIWHRKTIVLSANVIGLAFLGTSLCQDITAIAVGLVIAGMGAGLYLPSGIATITSLVDNRHWGKAIAIHELAPNAAFILAPVVAEVLLHWFSWRGVLGILGGTAIILGLLFGLFSKGGEFYGEPPAIRSIRSILRERAFWIMMILFSVGIGSTAGIYAMLPLYLVAERGLDQGWANTLVAGSRVIPLFVAVLSGWAADRFGVQRTMKVVLLLTGLFTILLAVTPTAFTILLVFLQPVTAVCFFPAALAALSSIGAASARNLVVSLAIPFSFVAGAGGVPTLIGFLGSRGHFSLGIAIAGGLIAAGSILPAFLKFPSLSKN